MEFNHISVLLEESIIALDIKPDGIYVDCTAGGGGHSAEVLKRLGENGRMILIDRDPDAISVLTERFKDDKRVTIIHDNYSNIKDVSIVIKKVAKATLLMYTLQMYANLQLFQNIQNELNQSQIAVPFQLN